MKIFKMFSKNKDVNDLWGEPKNEDFDFSLIESYFRNTNNASASQVINDRTIEDINFYELFIYLDRTNSRVGQQYLFNKLLTVNDRISFDEQEEWIDYLQKNEQEKKKIQLLLSKLNDRKSYCISNVFLDDYIKKPKYFFLIKILAILPILFFSLSFFMKESLILMIIFILVNLGVHYWNKRHIHIYSDSITQFVKLYNTVKELIKINSPILSKEKIHASIHSMDELKSKMHIFSLETKNNNSEIAALIFLILEYIKIVFLLEPLIVFNVLEKLDKKRKDMQILFEYVGSMDTFLSIASLRAGSPYYCKPTVSNVSNFLEFQDLFHPLIPNCIPNSLQVKEKSILLTGSNMSGKTTFIRSIGINLLLAQTINTCFAREFSSSSMRLFSAIRISDDLLNDKSYYFEEVLTIKEMIRESHTSFNNLLLLDEIFKGTNTIERIAAGKAVLSHIAKSENNIVFVSTHDIELAELLHDRYSLYHFTEVVQDGEVHFDYKLKSGKLTTRNAIRILEINDYPEDVIMEARRISDSISNPK